MGRYKKIRQTFLFDDYNNIEIAEDEGKHTEIVASVYDNIESLIKKNIGNKAY